MPAARERLAVAALAQPRRLEVGPAGEEADPPVPELEQVLGRRDGAVQVVRVDGRQVGGADVVVDRDDRRAERRRRRCSA